MPAFPRLLFRLAIFLGGIVATPTLLPAHASHPAYLEITREGAGLKGTWSIPVGDLRPFLDLDTSSARISWSDIEAHETALKNLLVDGLRLTREAAERSPAVGEVLLDRIDALPYLVFPFSFPNGAHAEGWVLQYNVFERLGSDHRCLATINNASGATQRVLQPHSRGVVLHFEHAGPHDWIAFIREGIWHILIGYDHILFLLALMIPAFWGDRSEEAGIAQITMRSVSIVSAFALAHSITLAVSALGWLRPPTGFIEVAIAVSVGLAALANLTPRGQLHGHRIAFTFGLLHGFGFANVLTGLNLTGFDLVPTLLSFNFGVELGQLLILAAIIPLAMTQRKWRSHRLALLRGGSLAIFGVSVCWVILRI